MPTLEKTVKDYVVEDFRSAGVFEKYGLDFCCGGGVPLTEACRKKGLDPEVVARELEAATRGPGEGGPNPAGWELDVLADHIEQTHHRYVREALPVVQQHAEKVARVHGANHPEVVTIADRFASVAGELTSHMQKEELILFPYIRAMVTDRVAGRPVRPAPFGSVRHPIEMMEAEHQGAGDAMADIRRLSRDFTPPDDACTTYRVLFQELAQFEADLHRHVHLENNILFPRAIALESA